ncbi:MAG: hypothetical protein ACL7AX_13000 [Candidatus Arsenophonus phytopathogenicus]
MSSKRKRVVLSMSQKVDIVNRLNKGESGQRLSEEYGVGTSTVSDIKKNAASILKFVSVLESEDGSSSRKMMRRANNDTVDDAVFKWFVQKRSQGQPISGPILCEKALRFNEMLNGPKDFKASTGWLRNFKARHGIRELEIQGEKMSSDTISAANFVATFRAKIEEENYDPDFLYNADETGLCWKALPNRTLASRRESAAPGHKTSKDRITVMTCSNSSGTHKIPLLVVGKSNKPRAFKNVKNLPVKYMSQKKAWMTTSLFVKWYDECFIPEVKKFQKETLNKTGKVLLILDNAPSHPCPEILERENGNFAVSFLPPNVTSILQPMDQGVIECLKRLYRKRLLRELLLTDEKEEEDVIKFYKKINLKDCVYMAADAWNEIKNVTLKRAWRKLNGLSEDENENNEERNEGELLRIIEEIPGSSACEVENVTDWLNCDQDDPGYQIMTDEEIVETLNNATAADEDDDCGDDDEMEDKKGPTHSEAFDALNVALEWAERQDECNPMIVLEVKRLRDLAARKRTTATKQKTITDYFKN